MAIKRQMDKQNVLHIYTMECYSALKKNDILIHGTTWMKLENIMLSEISQAQTDKYCMILLIWGAYYRHRRMQWHPTPVLLPGKSHGRRSLVGCSPWGREELDTTERLHFHFSLSCIGRGNGNPLQCSCLENPRDGGAWWAAVYGVTQTARTQLWTWLKRQQQQQQHDRHIHK